MKKPSLALPKEWYVIGPVARRIPLSAEMLRRVPRMIKAYGKKITPEKVSVENGRLDLAPLLGGTVAERSALVYIPFRMDRARMVFFGFGADWWFEAFLDGAHIYDTLSPGNIHWPPSVTDYMKAASLSKGNHLLVIRFISGTGSSLLTVACSDKKANLSELAKRQLCPPRLTGLFKPLELKDEKGPSSPLFTPLEIKRGLRCVARGIPFMAGELARIEDRPVTLAVNKVKAKWLVFMHSSDRLQGQYDEHGFVKGASKGRGQLGESAVRYVIQYADQTESVQPIRQQFEILMTNLGWGEDGIGCVRCLKPHPLPAHHEQKDKPQYWGRSQYRVSAEQGELFLYAWENPCPEKEITAIRFEPLSVPLTIFGITAGNVKSNPLRWESRKKVVLTLPGNMPFKPELDDQGQLAQIQLDLGQVISARPRSEYDHESWGKGWELPAPAVNSREILIEYTAHPEAAFHLYDGTVIPVASLAKKAETGCIRPIKAAAQPVKILVEEKGGGRRVPVRLHLHGEAGEYLAPMDRHRIPNPSWFEDYSADYVQGNHWSTYICGETNVKLPLGRVYVEITKGFEIRPVQQVIKVSRATKEVLIRVEKILNWREKGWVTADTYVHFLSPQTALLEGEAEGVNIVNLLASQWGELMTNVGDFDGKTTFGSKEAEGSGEYMVRVGTENRQHILGHISLLGYEGAIIAPMTTGGPAESALGDPVESLMTEWAERCKKQKGLVVIPHFPSPRLENAAVIVSGNADGVEFASSRANAAISPYSLSDWYRYLNCGYQTAAVGGTDKMSAAMLLGAVRTYAYIGRKKKFTYESWKDAVRRAATFVTTGPLMEFLVEGKMAGSRIRMKSSGGTVNVTWEAASIVAPMSRVELVRNGEIIESAAVKPESGRGNWEVKIAKSCWLALMIRDEKEQIVAHSSPVMVAVEGSEFYAAADAMTILEQIEGAIAYIDTIGTRAETRRFKAMKLKLTSIHRALHNRMHRAGVFHDHSPLDRHEHPDHEK